MSPPQNLTTPLCYEKFFLRKGLKKVFMSQFRHPPISYTRWQWTCHFLVIVGLFLRAPFYWTVRSITAVVVCYNVFVTLLSKSCVLAYWICLMTIRVAILRAFAHCYVDSSCFAIQMTRLLWFTWLAHYVHLLQELTLFTSGHVLLARAAINKL